MTVTEQAIENLADAFCQLSKPEHRPVFVEALKSIARIAQGELIFRMEVAAAEAAKIAATKH